MSLSLALMLLAVAWLAFSNGANDNFKGVATLFASRTTSYQSAINWAMITTLAGSIAALLLGTALIKAFSGKGLVEAQVLADRNFLLSVTLAAASTVYLATRIGFPISTTHAIVGGLVGAGLIAPGGVELLLLGSRFALPLLIAPLLAVALTLGLYALFVRARKALGVDRETCVCIGTKEHVVALNAPPLHPVISDNGTLSMQSACGTQNVTTDLKLSMGEEPECRQRYDGKVAGINAEKILNVLHFTTAGTVGFARGLQDTAKITGLLVGAGVVALSDPTSLIWGIVLVGVCMAAGGYFAAGKIADTLGNKIADMNAGQGFTANLVTSILVTGSALFGWGVSTTHCSVGGLFGIGIANGSGHWQMIKQIILAWLITLPVAASIAFVIFFILQRL
ncbi:MAG: inorganic phosphate transporter [Hyphomicrobiaceae bacterium]|nr:inorganic phosphate transporter [Hyphomicrobiaceae bacterium]